MEPLPFYTPIEQPGAATPLAPAGKPLLQYTPGVTPQGPATGMGKPAAALPAFEPIDVSKMFAKPAAPGAGSAAAPMLSGLAAADAQGVSYDKTSGVINTLVSGLAGAGGGALSGAAIGAAGGPIGVVGGALIGGAVGIISGATKAFFEVGAENKRKAARKKILAKAKKDQEARDAIARRDAIRGLRYDRKQTNLKNAWAMSQTMQQSMVQNVNANQTLRDNFIKSGFIRPEA